MKSLLMITHWYPINHGDASFISSEILYLAKKIESIHVLCLNGSLKERTVLKVPDNVTVHFYKQKYKNIARLMLLPDVLLSPLFYNEILILFKKKEFTISKLIRTVIFLSTALYYKKVIERILKEAPDIKLIYTYWYLSETMAVILLKQKFKIKCITRAHGGDLYTVQAYQAYKCYMDVYLDKIVFISKNGYEYYLKTFARSTIGKYSISRLGTINRAEVDFYNHNKTFDIISCSYMISLKRINLIIDALSLLDEIDLVWTHIGDGPDYEYITNQAYVLLKDKKNITYNFTGFLDNFSIMELYMNRCFGCFLSTSESEGLPVSMMEAISFGIPVIGTDVGGVSEIVNAHTGILLDANPSADEIKEAILTIYNYSGAKKIALRKSARIFWEEKFNAEKNYTKFAEEIYDWCE